ncbi:MAG TPA: S66 peptidase family protein [Jatrophihabitans sp.]|nr:S66 peptidase family protein [Jatrophihabitans sp.]
MPLVRPVALAGGATIAIVTPSWPGPGLLPDRFDRAVSALRAAGFVPRPMPHARLVGDGVRGWLAGSPAERVADLHRAFADPEVAAVLIAIGGDHSAQLLEELDFELIRANPKVFCGYSDSTVLLHAVHAATGLVTCYGPALLPEFGDLDGPAPETVRHFTAVTGRSRPAGALPRFGWTSVEDRAETDAAGRPRRREVPEPRRILRPGRATGPLLAGCLPSLRHLVGTRWRAEHAGRILAIEVPDGGYHVADADADLTLLRNTGVLGELAGLVIGRTPGWSAEEIAQLDACALEATRGYRLPVLGGLEFGHVSPMCTLPIGVRATLDGDELTIDEPAVREPAVSESGGIQRLSR